MVALDTLLQVLRDVVERGLGQKAPLATLDDGRRVGTSAIRSDSVRRKQRLIRQHLAEEPLGRVEVAPGGQEEVDGCTMLVEGVSQTRSS